VTDFPSSLIEFQYRFADEAACAAYLAAARWPHGFVCPGCDKTRAWELQTKPWTYECAGCGRQTSVTAGTIMHHSKLPLTTWFWAAYLMATHSNGISALQLQRQLGLGLIRAPGCSAPSCAAACSLPAARRSPVWWRSMRPSFPAAAETIRAPAAGGAAARARSWLSVPSRCRTAVPAPVASARTDTRLLGAQPARLPRRPSHPRCHRQDRRAAQLRRRPRRTS
jgi:hypothetical protein